MVVSRLRTASTIVGCFAAYLSVLCLGNLRTSKHPERHIESRRCVELGTDETQLQEIQHFGAAPVRGAPAGPDKERYADTDSSTSNSHHHHHRLHLPGHGHRHTRSREEPAPPRPPAKDTGNGHAIRPVKTRQDSSASLRNLKDSISAPITTRSTFPLRNTSPTPSRESGLSREATMPVQRSPADTHSGKRSLLDKIRRPKGDRAAHESLAHMAGSKISLQESLNSSRYDISEFSPHSRGREGSVATFDSGSTAKAGSYGEENSPSSKKETASSRILHSHGKLRGPKRHFSYES